jgi:cyclic pyranopterin phosphate synthase
VELPSEDIGPITEIVRIAAVLEVYITNLVMTINRRFVFESHVKLCKVKTMTRSERQFSHLTPDGKPAMVDVIDKIVTRRIARAQALVRFPSDVAKILHANGFRSKKGSVFDVAIVAGTMAVKKTAEIIPFCHTLPVEKCDFLIEMQDDVAVITCEVGVEGKTGVEMEALHGASVAALTIYDMCKALSHHITIESIQLMHKSGGKS